MTYDAAVENLIEKAKEVGKADAIAEIARLRAALQFYADPFAWKRVNDPDDVVGVPDFYSELSFGDTAASALRDSG